MVGDGKTSEIRCSKCLNEFSRSEVTFVDNFYPLINFNQEENNLVPVCWKCMTEKYRIKENEKEPALS